MAQNNYTANVKFRYDAESDRTHLLVRFPGETWYTKIASKDGRVSRTEATRILQLMTEYLSEKGHTATFEILN